MEGLLTTNNANATLLNCTKSNQTTRRFLGLIERRLLSGIGTPKITDAQPYLEIIFVSHIDFHLISKYHFKRKIQ